MPLRFDLAFALGLGCSEGGRKSDVDDIQELVDFPASSCPDLPEIPSMPFVRLEVPENRDRVLCGLPEPNVSCEGSPLPSAEPRAPRRAICPAARNFESAGFFLCPGLRELREVLEPNVSSAAARAPRRATCPAARNFECADLFLRPGLRELREVPEPIVSSDGSPLPSSIPRRRPNFPATRNFVSADFFLRPALRAETGDEDRPVLPRL